MIPKAIWLITRTKFWIDLFTLYDLVLFTVTNVLAFLPLLSYLRENNASVFGIESKITTENVLFLIVV